ncbi:MAG: opioid growth factor receptor-related protein [Brevundimonas sp.]|uniref:opioid growth factor receptor-related protein n=1 Tax=Brevundimonas sp. TaxID=1871086 RepID=UPI00273778F5|nr:opioid growth factor receptor-related protein [Brevundimonas sp.]MDP3405285.1 opioid growth factor receptor-related protein [Brevundimonas sp.]
MSSAIVDFLTGAGTDSAGRDIFQVLAMKDDALEETQDYIQWLFPLRERSGAPSGSPTLTDEDVTLIQRSSLAASALAAGSDRMAIFYFRNGHWLTTSDHNHLRITRIIKSLRLLRGDASADAFRNLILARVADAGGPVGAPSLGFWDRA